MHSILKISLYVFFSLVYFSVTAQVSGNYNYNRQRTTPTYPLLNPILQNNTYQQVQIKVRGLYNQKASQQNAIISMTQIGQNIEEVNRLMDGRIAKIRQGLNALSSDIQCFVDMVSFVPMYEYDLEKKPFNKKTYQEIPIGFEVKKNLHIGYIESEMIHQILAICAQNEVYDLVRVDYISNQFEAMQDSLRAEAFKIYKKTIAHYEKVIGIDFSKKQKTVSDGFNVSYPPESYQVYQAFSQSELPTKKGAIIQKEKKNTTLHYQPILFKNHQFVINPEVIEPSIQMVYELIVLIKLEEIPKITSPSKEYFIISPEGHLKQLDIH